MVDRFEKDPLEVHRQQDGEIQFKDTGDDLIDRWEQQLADGDDVDLMEAFTPESMARLKELQAKAKGIKAPGTSFADTVNRFERQAQQEEVKRKKISTFGGDY